MLRNETNCGLCLRRREQHLVEPLSPLSTCMTNFCIHDPTYSQGHIAPRICPLCIYHLDIIYWLQGLPESVTPVVFIPNVWNTAIGAPIPNFREFRCYFIPAHMQVQQNTRKKFKHKLIHFVYYNQQKQSFPITLISADIYIYMSISKIINVFL